MTHSQRLRNLASRTGLDGFADELRAMADEIDAQPAALPDPIKTAISKLKSAQMCHPNAVQQLIEEALAALQSQPAALPELSLADIVVDVVRKPMGGFAYVNTTGITVTHKPSGISVTAASGRSQHVNRQAALDKLRAILALRPQAVPMTDEPEWIVNDLGELGVRVGSRFFFLYKGGNIEYGADGIGDSRDGVALHGDGTPMHYRIVGKREFGETCWPLQWVVRGHSENRYTEPLTFIPGLSWGKPEDGEWKPLPAHGITAQGAQGGEG